MGSFPSIFIAIVAAFAVIPIVPAQAPAQSADYFAGDEELYEGAERVDSSTEEQETSISDEVLDRAGSEIASRELELVEAPPVDIDVNELRAIYQRMSARDERNVRAEELVAILGKLGTPKAVGLLTEILEDNQFEFPNRAQALADALGPHVNKRIFAAARANLERSIADGHDSLYRSYGYLELIARRESRESARVILSVINDRNASAQVRRGACALIGHLKGLVEPEKIIRTASAASAKHIDERVLRGLASWKDSGADRALTRIAFESGQPEAYAALGRFVEPQELDALLAPFESGGARERSAVVHAVSSLRDNRALTPEQRAHAGVPILAQALADETGASLSKAAFAVEVDAAYHTEEIATVLAHRIEEIADTGRRAELEQALYAVDYTLGE